MKLVAITGSIGCGKTTLAGLVQNAGYTVFDVDGWVRRLYYKKDFVRIVCQCFPEAEKDGKIDKRKLRNLVFSYNNKLKLLESLIHPFLKNYLKKIIRRYANCDDVFFIDVALLFEMGWDKYCDLVVVADADYKIQKMRVMERDKVSEEDFDKINSVQMKQSQKKKLADIVIDTNKPLNILKTEMLRVIEGMTYGQRNCF